MARVRPEVPTVADAPATRRLERPRTGSAKRKREVAETPDARRTALRQLALIGGIAGCAFVTAALATWNADDPSFSSAGGGVVRNVGGPAGAVVADLLYQACGYASWSVLAVASWLTLRLAGRAVGGWASWLLTGGGVWMLAGTLDMLVAGAPDRAFPPGGVIGLVTHAALRAQVGGVGAALALTTGLIACVTLLFGINWQPIAAVAVDRVQTATPAAARLATAAGRSVVTAGASAGGALIERLRAPKADPAEDEPDEIASVADIAPDLPSVWSARPAPPPRLALAVRETDPPTRVGGQSLVEVEYDPTTAVRRVDPVEVPEPALVPLPAVEPLAPAEPVEFARQRAQEPEPEPEPDPVDQIASPPPSPERPRRRRDAGVQVVPGDLRSGGAGDDGRAVRATASPFQLPPLSLLDDHPAIVGAADEGRLHDLAHRLTAKLKDFGVDGKVTAIRPGPVITMFEYEPAPGIKISKIASLADDIAMALRAQAVRVVAPIPGRGVVGVEVPNDVRQTVWARDVFASNDFRDGRHTLPVVLGKDTEGRPYVADLSRMPHLLVGGTTGSGKSVGINAMLVSLLLTRTPEELRLILIDPKQLEFELYKEVPHLLHPVVTDARLASKVLSWACDEMDQRYRLLGDWKVRNIENYNLKVDDEAKDWTPEKAHRYFPDWPEGQLMPRPRRLPYIVVVIDELADLMMVASKDVETSIARLAQKARASGIHLVVATQSPRADVVTGLIRANMPSRLSYQVRTGTESRIILDAMGAQSLLGKGDLLFMPPGVAALTRIHGPFLADDEVRRVGDFVREQGPPDYAPAIRLDEEDEGEGGGEEEELDEEMGRYYDEILEFAVEKGSISTSMIQRQLKIGYNRACLLMEHLEREGIVGPADGAKPRKVLVQQ